MILIVAIAILILMLVIMIYDKDTNAYDNKPLNSIANFSAGITISNSCPT